MLIVTIGAGREGVGENQASVTPPYVFGKELKLKKKSMYEILVSKLKSLFDSFILLT
jgi:hypothetical protein